MSRKTTGILELFHRHNDAFAARVGYGRAHETYARYRIVCKHLERYIRKKYRKDDIPLTAASTPGSGRNAGSRPIRSGAI